MLGELNTIQINNVLTSQVIGRLACSNNNQPYIVPVTYAYDGTYIYGQSNFGRKIRMLRENPMVCFEVDTMTDMRNWQSVVIFGRFEELQPAESEKARALLYNRVFSLESSSTVHLHEHGAEAMVDDSTRIKNIMYRIKINKITGRFEKQ
jgi:hypothetical protein